MFTSHMTEDELQAVAYRDFLEIRMSEDRLRTVYKPPSFAQRGEESPPFAD